LLPVANREGGRHIYIVDLVQEDSIEAKNPGKWPIGWDMGPTMWPQSGTTWWPLFPPHGSSVYFSSSHDLCFLGKNNVVKRLGSFDVRKVQLKNTQNMDFYFAEFNPK
jgi:hypothetical protein